MGESDYACCSCCSHSWLVWRLDEDVVLQVTPADRVLDALAAAHMQKNAWHAAEGESLHLACQ